MSCAVWIRRRGCTRRPALRYTAGSGGLPRRCPSAAAQHGRPRNGSHTRHLRPTPVRPLRIGRAAYTAEATVADTVNAATRIATVQTRGASRRTCCSAAHGQVQAGPGRRSASGGEDASRPLTLQRSSAAIRDEFGGFSPDSVCVSSCASAENARAARAIGKRNGEEPVFPPSPFHACRAIARHGISRRP